MSKFTSFFVIAFALLLTVSCTRNDAQREFEQEAYRSPDGYTETAQNNGEVLSNDPDDWRTSPLFQGLIIVKPPYPNPVTTNQPVWFEIGVTGVNSINGLQVFTRLDNGEFISLFENFETLQPGDFPPFQINPIEFGMNGTPEGARGLNRIYIFNANSQLISYGDILVE
ncbi:MAG: hypothetical protein WD357_10750 [Gracilimonas sp.]